MGCKLLPLGVTDFLFDVTLTHRSSEFHVVIVSVFFFLNTVYSFDIINNMTLLRCHQDTLPCFLFKCCSSHLGDFWV